MNIKKIAQNFGAKANIPRNSYNIGEDIIDFVNQHESVLNKHKIAQTVRTKMLQFEVNKKRGFLSGFKKELFSTKTGAINRV